MVVASGSVRIFCVFCLRCIEYVHQNSTLNLKTSLSALELNLMNAIFIKIQYWVWLGTYSFWLNSSFGAGLKGSELKSIFHCTAHLEIFKKSCFRIIVFVVI